jgi:hypothetical protein
MEQGGERDEMRKQLIGSLLVLLALSAGCGPAAAPAPAPSAEPPTLTASPSLTSTPPPTQTASLTVTRTPTSTPVPGLPVFAGFEFPIPLAAIGPGNADRMTELARWGGIGRVNDAALSPDGKLLALASDLGVYLYRTQTMSQDRLVETEAEVIAVAFAPDGKTFVTADYDHTLCLWNTATGEPVRTFPNFGVVWYLAYSPDGKSIAGFVIKDFKNYIRQWDTQTGEIQFSIQTYESLWGLAYSPDGRMLAYTGSAGTLDRRRVAQLRPGGRGCLQPGVFPGQQTAGGRALRRDHPGMETHRSAGNVFPHPGHRPGEKPGVLAGRKAAGVRSPGRRGEALGRRNRKEFIFDERA